MGAICPELAAIMKPVILVAGLAREALNEGGEFSRSPALCVDCRGG